MDHMSLLCEEATREKQLSDIPMRTIAKVNAYRGREVENVIRVQSYASRFGKPLHVHPKNPRADHYLNASLSISLPSGVSLGSSA
jgi:hypothetical protein